MQSNFRSVNAVTTLTKDESAVDQLKHQDSSNRLAPYNPTHATAREKALDLLDLSENDVLFDLGCGDGRLLFTAMERFYDDDYLMKEHQKIFNNAVTTFQQPKHERAQSNDNVIVSGAHEGKEVTFNDDRKRMGSIDSQSQPRIPHMMCTASDDEDESRDLSFDTPSKILSVAIKNTPQATSEVSEIISPLLSPLPPMPATPTTSNRKSHKKDFPTLHFSPIQSDAIKEIQDVPLTITASCSSNEEKPHNDDGSEPSPRDRKWSITFSDTPSLFSSSSVTMGLRCVGIEYDQALVEAANNQIDSFKMYESFDADWVKKRLCIKWGDVFDEWNAPDIAESVDGKMESFAQHLNLLEDATAVFVYLLPEGLKKVKPLLQEAARRRREQVIQQQMEEKHQQCHRKDYSHVSDITDYDFFRATTQDYVTEKKATQVLPAFRVVSYMFSIPGWTPTKVDRSSKGGCPLYLYENVTEEE